MMVVRMSRLIGKELNHIPFRGAGPAMQAVIAGQVPMMSDSLPSAASHIRQGSVVVVRMASAERHAAFPDVPTFREQGFDIVSDSWFGFSFPAGVPAGIVDRLNRETRGYLADPAVRARFAELGGTPGISRRKAIRNSYGERWPSGRLSCRLPALRRISRLLHNFII